MKYVKWKIASFYAYWKGELVGQDYNTDERQELPEAPVNLNDNASCLLSGRAYRWIRYLRLRHPGKFDQFITSVLDSKSGMERPGDDLLKLNEESTFSDLTTEEAIVDGFRLPIPSVEGEEFTFVSLDKFKSELRRTTTEVFGGHFYSIEDRIKPFVPSTSANYINSRDKMGAIGTILKDRDLMSGLRTTAKLVDIRKVNGGRGGYEVNDRPLLERFQILYNRIVSRAYHELPVAVPHALPEALKVRVITKGPPYIYTALKPLQKFLHRILRSHPTFALTGTPVTSFLVSRQLGKLQEGMSFCSADYKNATNDMMSWASESVVHAISDTISLPEEERDLFLKAMTKHVIENKKTGLQKPQTHGQLMGSVVSFIVLCVVNATICRMALEYSSGRLGSMSLQSCRMLINGDDAVFQSTKEGFECWKRIAKFAGMAPSVGKVYRSRYFLNINSTTFNYHHDGWICDRSTREMTRFELVKRVKLGLLKGLKRSGGKLDVTDEGKKSLGAKSRKLIEMGPSDLGETLLKKFIKFNSDALKTVNTPWFIPERFGGIGLPSVGRYCPSDKDLRLARKIWDHPDKYKLPQKPDDVEWRTWKYAQSRFNPKPAVLMSGQESIIQSNPVSNMTSVSEVMAKLCVEALFRSDANDLYKPLKDGRIKTVRQQTLDYLRERAAVFKKALLDQTVKLPEPFNPHKYPDPEPNFDDQKLIRNTIDASFERTVGIQNASACSDLEKVACGDGDSFINVRMEDDEEEEGRLAFVSRPKLPLRISGRWVDGRWQ
jgi:hypothetical protein